MAEKEPEITEGKLREALKSLEAEEKEIGLRKNSIASYLNTRRANQGLQRENMALTKERDELKETMERARVQHIDDWNKREVEYKQRSADLEAAQAKQREANEKEAAAWKVKLTLAKKQATDAEKEATEKVDAAHQTVVDALSKSRKLIEDLDKEIQVKRDKIAALDEEFRSIAQKHGLAAAVNN